MEAHCTSGDRCPGGRYANGNTESTLCDGAPVYQRDAGGGDDGPVLFRMYSNPLPRTGWFVSSSDRLADCDGTAPLISAEIPGSSGSTPTAPGYSAGDGWLDNNPRGAVRDSISVAVVSGRARRSSTGRRALSAVLTKQSNEKELNEVKHQNIIVGLHSTTQVVVTKLGRLTKDKAVLENKTQIMETQLLEEKKQTEML